MALVALDGSAHAFPSWMEPTKKGIFMFNLKFGAAVGLRDVTTNGGTSLRGDDFFALILDFGVAVTPDHNGYIVLPLQFQLHEIGTGQVCVQFDVLGRCIQFAPGAASVNPWQVVMVPIGFQYDIPIKAVPGLYITPRIVAGYAAYVPDVGNTINAGFIAPEVGAKLVIKSRFNVGFEPLSLPIFFAPNYPSSGHTYVTVDWRLLWYGGFNF